MRNQTHFRISAGIALVSVLVWGGISRAQEAPSPKLSIEPISSHGNKPVESAATPCVQPSPMVNLGDYNGPLKKTVGLFARDLERKTVHTPHYKPGIALCSLDLEDKFFLFVRDSFDPVTFLASGFNAGLDQAKNQDPTFGQGTAGYGKRFGASFADQASFKFFKDFAYPSIFYEDPRYYRLIHGSGGRRFLHAIEHSIVAHRNDGAPMFNYSEWLGTASAITLSNVYHPGNRRGLMPAAQLVGYSVLSDMGFDILREFWPEISRKFKLPFRAEPVPEDLASIPVRN